MDLSVSPCFHCPATFVEASIFLAIGVAAFVAGVLLRQSQRRLVRVFGWFIMVPGLLWLALLTISSWKYGVAWTESQLGKAELLPSLLFALIPAALCTAVLVTERRSRRT